MSFSGGVTREVSIGGPSSKVVFDVDCSADFTVVQGQVEVRVTIEHADYDCRVEVEQGGGERPAAS